MSLQGFIRQMREIGAARQRRSCMFPATEFATEFTALTIVIDSYYFPCISICISVHVDSMLVGKTLHH